MLILNLGLCVFIRIFPLDSSTAFKLHVRSSHILYLWSNYFVQFSRNVTAYFKNVNNCLNTNIYSYLETSGGQIYNLYLNIVHFFNASVN
jgi:hypothetical protein